MSTEKRMRDLHSAVAAEFLRQLKTPGNDGVPAAVLKQAIEFLRDNGVTADPRTGKLRSLVEGMELVDDEMPRVPRKVG